MYNNRRRHVYWTLYVITILLADKQWTFQYSILFPHSMNSNSIGCFWHQQIVNASYCKKLFCSLPYSLADRIEPNTCALEHSLPDWIILFMISLAMNLNKRVVHRRFTFHTAFNVEHVINIELGMAWLDILRMPSPQCKNRTTPHLIFT